MRTTGLLLIALIALTGCATDKDYLAYLSAQQEANKQAAANAKPLLEIEAMEGQQITGLKAVRVNMPGQAPVIQQAQQSQWAGVVNNALGVTGTVLGIRYAGQAAIGLANATGQAANAGYSHIQAPGAVTTTSISGNSGANSGNSGKLAGQYQTDSTSTPTVVTAPDPIVTVVQPSYPPK